MVVIGGITRLTHSGLSMVEWNMIIGSLPPTTEAEWQVPFNKYKQTPEYKLINNQFSLNEFKSIYWWEYSHRFLGRTIGLVFLLPFLFFWITKRFNKPLLRKMLVLLILGAFQGVLGWYMVKSGLQKDPNVSHFRLAAHLISAFTVFGFTLWYALDLIHKNTPKHSNSNKKKISNLVLILFGVVVLQIIYGAFVAGLKAGYIFNTFPLMGSELLPDAVTAYKSLLENMLNNPSGVQFVHRTIAYIVFTLAFYIWYQTEQMELSYYQKKAANIMLAAVILQFSLGITTILYMHSIPVVIGVLHQTGAFLLFTTCLWFIYTLHKSL